MNKYGAFAPITEFVNSTLLPCFISAQLCRYLALSTVWFVLIALAVGIPIVLFYSLRGTNFTMAIRKANTSNSLFNQLLAFEGKMIATAQRIIDKIDGEEIPAKTNEISSLSTAITYKQSEIDQAIQRRNQASSYLNLGAASAAANSYPTEFTADTSFIESPEVLPQI